MLGILCFIGGICVGVVVGGTIMALCAMSKEVDKEMKEMDENDHI